MRTLTKETQSAVTPQNAIEILKKGNERFVANLRAHRNLLEQKNETAEEQYPFAFILSCIDSRTSAELIFDQGLGDVFSCRIAGNIVNEDILGSMEFACKVARAKVIVVLGHTECGAVEGVCDDVQMGHLTTLLQKLKPAVAAETTTTHDRSAANSRFVGNVATLNVKLTIAQISRRSPVLKDMIEKGEIAIVGGMHDLETGRVEFYDKD